MIEKLLAAHPNSIVVDAGNMSLADRQMPVVFPLLKAMKYSAVGVGQRDYYSLNRYLAAAKDAGVPVINVAAEDKDGVAPFVIKQVGGVRVGILSFGYAPQDQEGLELRKRRYVALKEAREKSDFLILMDEGNVATDDWLTRQAGRWGAPDVIIGNQQGMALGVQPKVVGKSRYLPSTYQAKAIGVLDVKIEPGKDPEVNYSQSPIPEEIAENPAAKKALDDLAAAETQRAQAMSTGVGLMTAENGTPMPANSGSPGAKPGGVYYDSRTCAPCHKPQYDSWAASKHAVAVKTLVDAGRDMPECLSCHSERFRQTGAYLPTDERSNLSVECASCHSKVLPHGDTGPAKDIAGPKISLDTCRACHNKDRSPNFEKDSKDYWKKAGHKPAK